MAPFLQPFGALAPGKILLPPKAIIAWDGLIADIPAGWVLCDGANGTPNLADKMILGASDAYPLGSAGGSLSASLATTTGGAHATNSGNNLYSGSGFFGSSSGGHAHTAGITMQRPLSTSLLYLMCFISQPIPTGALVWSTRLFTGVFSRHDNYEKYLLGKVDNVRADVGASPRTFSATFSSSGYHGHGNNGGTWTDGAGLKKGKLCGVGAGGHGHVLTSANMTVPPTLPLLLLRAWGRSGSRRGLVLAYNGLLAELQDTPWRLCDGAGESPDLRGRFPRHCRSDNSDFLIPEGDSTHDITLSIPTESVYHDHTKSYTDGVNSGSPNIHNAWTWTHSHTLSGSLTALPPYISLNYIYCEG